jgi:hypothetical protein
MIAERHCKDDCRTSAPLQIIFADAVHFPPLPQGSKIISSNPLRILLFPQLVADTGTYVAELWRKLNLVVLRDGVKTTFLFWHAGDVRIWDGSIGVEHYCL